TISAVLIEGRGCQYLVLPFGLSLTPHVSTEVMEVPLIPLREQGIRFLDYLKDWLILAQSQDQLYKHRDLVLSHISQLGLYVYQEKSKFFPIKRISFLGIELDLVKQTVHLMQERAQSAFNSLNTFERRMAVPLKQLQRLLGHMAATVAVTLLGLLHMRLLQHWLHGRVTRWAWHDTGLPPNLHPVAGVASSMPCLEPSQRALTTLRLLCTSTDEVVYAPVACRNSSATFSGVR
ncbi:hypothetical protein M9458_018313, partial [Cirrhinus mrigala]